MGDLQVSLQAVDYEVDIELRGSGVALEALADQIRTIQTEGILQCRLATAAASVAAEGNPMNYIEVQRTNAGPLRVSRRDGTLVIQGGPHAMDIVVVALEGVALAAKTATDRAVMRHVHIEYLGPGDEVYRAADSLPLVVTSEWPDS